MHPFFMPSKGLAIRAFSDTAQDSKSSIAAHPADYTLFELGEFNDSDCSFALLKTPVSLGLALELASGNPPLIASQDC